jgi:hypothetical protein
VKRHFRICGKAIHLYTVDLRRQEFKYQGLPSGKERWHAQRAAGMKSVVSAARASLAGNAVARTLLTLKLSVTRIIAGGKHEEHDLDSGASRHIARDRGTSAARRPRQRGRGDGPRSSWRTPVAPIPCWRYRRGTPNPWGTYIELNEGLGKL